MLFTTILLADLLLFACSCSYVFLFGDFSSFSPDFFPLRSEVNDEVFFPFLGFSSLGIRWVDLSKSSSQPLDNVSLSFFLLMNWKFSLCLFWALVSTGLLITLRFASLTGNVFSVIYKGAVSVLLFLNLLLPEYYVSKGEDPLPCLSLPARSRAAITRAGISGGFRNGSTSFVIMLTVPFWLSEAFIWYTFSARSSCTLTLELSPRLWLLLLFADFFLPFFVFCVFLVASMDLGSILVRFLVLILYWVFLI